jgi:hypothetical protein
MPAMDNLFLSTYHRLLTHSAGAEQCTVHRRPRHQRDVGERTGRPAQDPQ